MFELGMPWWEFVLRGVVVYAALMLLVRISGKRTVGQFTPFDLLVVMLLSESVSASLSGPDESLIGGLIGAATLVALNIGMGYLSTRSPRMETLIEGSPVLIGRDGKLFDEVLVKQRIGAGEVHRALREADCELENLKCAFLEPNGAISVMKKQS
jgi:uncharacterized membrane protein YcaP (DUF421 family)